MATKSAEQEIDERSKLAGNNQFELLLFRLGESKKTGQRELFGVGPPSVPETTNSCPCKCIG